MVPPLARAVRTRWFVPPFTALLTAASPWPATITRAGRAPRTSIRSAIRAPSGFWAAWLFICNTLTVIFSWQAWEAFMDARSPVTEMPSTVPADEVAALEAWYARGISHAPQVIACSCAAALTLFTGLRIPATIAGRTPVAIASLLVSGFVAGHAFYFVVHTVLFCRKYRG